MNIRTYRPGDEAAQAEIYNEAAGGLPRFKPATVDEVGRRSRAVDFDPGGRLFAEDGDRVVGYCAFHANGRVSYPWCRPGSEGAAEPLFQAVLQGMRQRGLRRAFAAYRGDWPVQQSYFRERGFQPAREMVNYVLNLADMPTRVQEPGEAFTPLRREDVPAIRALAPEVFQVTGVGELERHLFENPYFGPEALFVLRRREDGSAVAAGVLVVNASYADPRAVDPAMPCFRLGAFGTEGMQTKRVNGLFSLVARDDAHLRGLALSLLEYAARRLEQTDWGSLAAQVPSDAPHLHRFYQEQFCRQGSFPVLERML